MSKHTERSDGSCIHHIVERHGTRAPMAVAVKSPDGSVTYEELTARASRLASCLRAAGVEHGHVVALSMRRSVDMIVSMLAVLKAGAAYLPIEESSPPARKRKYLDDAGVLHIIADGERPELRDERRTLILAKDATRRSGATEHEHSTPDSSQPDDRAYVMFTSGSTGEAKGVVVPHRAVTRLVLDTNYIEISPADRILQLSPPSFDASTFEIWGALLNGATLVLSSEHAIDPNALKRDIAEGGVTVMWLTAALFHLIGDRYTDALRPVKTLLAGGDVLSPRIVNRVLDAIPHITIINGYGPTENTTFTCCHRMTRSNPPPIDGVPIGKPISGTEVFVLDESFSPVRAGDVGELFTAGKGLALGYLNGDRAGSFFRDSRICDGLVYRTGDLVRENSSHELEFIGRRDNLVKLRGFRVSLEGIKQGLLKIADVVDAAVFVRKEDAGDQLLVAYVETRQGSSLQAAEVRRQLRGDLPDYMIPDSILLSEALPITNNGKLDKAVLISCAT